MRSTANKDMVVVHVDNKRSRESKLTAGLASPKKKVKAAGAPKTPHENMKE